MSELLWAEIPMGGNMTGKYPSDQESHWGTGFIWSFTDSSANVERATETSVISALAQ